MRVAILILVLGLQACSISPVKTVQSSQALEVQLSGADKKKTFYLLGQNSKVIAKANARTKQLNFKLPRHVSLNQCFAVLDQKGKSLFKDTKRFKMPLALEKRKALNLKRAVEQKVSLASSQQNKHQRQLKSTINALENNRAFVDRGCYLPKEKPWPAKPVTKCENYDECAREGAGICYSRFFGVEGCAHAAKSVNIPGFLSSPACSAAVANLVKEKYSGDDFVADVLHGLADDFGDAWIKSESGFMQALGILLKGGNYLVKLDKAKQCSNQFVNIHYGPKARWINTVNDIVAEPTRSLKQCESLVFNHNDYADKIKQDERDVSYYSGKLAHVEVVERYLHSRDDGIIACDAKKDISLGYVSNNGVKRYMLGAGIKNYTASSQAKSTGVELTAIFENTPAQKAGLKVGDIVQKINGQSIRNSTQMLDYIQQNGVKSVNVQYLRKDKVQSTSLSPETKYIDMNDI